MLEEELLMILKENEFFRQKDKKSHKEIENLKQRLTTLLIKSADLMVCFIELKDSLDFYKKFNYSTDKVYLEGYNKAFEIFEKIIQNVGVKL